MTLGVVLADLVRHPVENLVHRWNWKAALCSATVRGLIFWAVNASAGPAAGLQALATEFCLRGTMSGFYGAITQALSRVTPAWAGSLCAVVLLPVIAHTAEFVVHGLAGTPLLGESIMASVALTMFTTFFNTFAMRRGVLTVGPDSRSLKADILALPATVVAFTVVVARALWRTTGGDPA